MVFSSIYNRAESLPLDTFLRYLNGEYVVHGGVEKAYEATLVEVKYNGFKGLGYGDGRLLSKNGHDMKKVCPVLFKYWENVVFPRIKGYIVEDEVLVFECCVMQGGVEAERTSLLGYPIPTWTGGYTDLASLWLKRADHLPVRFVLIGSNMRNLIMMAMLWETPQQLNTVKEIWNALLTEEGIVALLRKYEDDSDDEDGKKKVVATKKKEVAVKVKYNIFNPVPLYLVAMDRHETLPCFCRFYFGFEDRDFIYVIAVSDFSEVIVDQYEPNGKAQLLAGDINGFQCDSQSFVAVVFNALNDVSVRVSKTKSKYSFVDTTSNGELKFRSGTVFCQDPRRVVATLGTNDLFFCNEERAEDVRLQCVHIISLHDGDEFCYSVTTQKYPKPRVVTAENLYTATKQRLIRNPDRSKFNKLLCPTLLPLTLDDALIGEQPFAKQ